MHTHYKNIRLVNSIHDWLNLAEGFKDSLDRWKKRGQPMPKQGQHIELCRKKIMDESENDTLEINLNENLYIKNDGIFSEGSEIDENTYIHLKIRDVRIEMSESEFKELADAVTEAQERLEDSSLRPSILAP